MTSGALAVGQMDMLLSPASQGGAEDNVSSALSAFFLNQTMIASATADVPDVLGTAPRWTFLGQLISRDRPTRNASCIVLVIDSRAEARIDLGTRWDRRPLGEQETYVVRGKGGVGGWGGRASAANGCPIP